MAVYVTKVPAHTGLPLAEIETLTGKVGTMVIVIVFDVAGLPVMQEVKLDVMIQAMASLFTGT